MVDAPPTWGIGSQEPDQQARRAIPFLVTGIVDFAPAYFPETIRVRKEREIDRTQNFCRGEDVSDTGGKNRDIHITGMMLGNEKDDFEDLLDLGEPVDMSSTTWSGQVLVGEGEYEGPVGWDPQLKEHQYQYTVDFIATGAERNDATAGNGIVSAPDDYNSGAFDPEGDFINRGP